MEKIQAAFSLRWKILAWFFVNLLVIGGILFAFLRAEFHVGINSLLAGPTNDRLEAVVRPLARELRTLPSTEWNAALERALTSWRERGLRAGLYRSNGTYLAGDVGTLPSDVLKTLADHEARHFGPPGGWHGPPFGRPPGASSAQTGQAIRPDDPSGGIPGLLGPPPDVSFDEPGGPPPDPANGGRDGARERPPFDGPPDGREEAGTVAHPSGDELPTGPLPKFMLATDSPRLYWAGVYLGHVQRPRPGVPPGVSLLIMSDSLRGGGLFFDYVPWLLVGGSLVGISVLLWLPFVHGLTHALARMTVTAEEIAQGRFDPAPPSVRRDELGRLGRALGHMAARLDGFVTGQKRFLGDTAHELLSPLARLEVALSILEKQANLNGNRRYAERALDEVHHLSDIVQDLLSFTKAGMREKGATLQPVALAEIARAAVHREAAEEWVVVTIDETLRVCAEPDLLTRALANAIRNAVRYAGEAGPITLSAEPVRDNNGDEIVDLLVSDQGPGVPPESLDRLFDPFYRPEDARTRETGGNGLGLAIVKSCVEACGGRVSVQNRVPPGLELTFTLRRA